MSDPFDPLGADQKLTSMNIPETSEDHGTAITPVPRDVEFKIPYHSLGSPKAIWDYLDEKGCILFKVCRFVSQGKKVDLPLSYREYRDGRKKWAWKGIDAPRPLYGLDRLARNPDAAVIVCEGEKAVDAATKLFPDHVCVTSPNGAGSPHKADWAPLCNCDVTIWPDNDTTGYEYAHMVANLLKDVETKFVRIVQMPDAFEEKWDLADKLPEGYTREDIQQLLDNAEEFINPLENLIERIKVEGVGAAYKPEVLDALGQLYRSDRPAYMNLRDELKKARVGITFLDQSIQDRAKETGESSQEPNHLDIARDVINTIGYENILSSQSHTWIWLDKGVWEPANDRTLKKPIHTCMESKDIFVTRSVVDSVVDVLKTEVLRDEHEWNTNNNTINVLNGELLWVAGEWKLEAHCREHYRTTQIPIIYDPNADCPRFKRFLQEIFDGDDDAADKATLILEMMGYTLVSHASFERFILLIGSGANGKSVIMDVIRALVGKDNVAAVQPSQFDNRFQRAHLHLKLANLVTEISEGGQIADAELKAITSGEITTVEHKNKDPFDFLPFATCWFGTNHMPHTRDFSNALFRRALVVPFKNTFKEGVNADPNLKKHLSNELQGIFNMALHAFGGVMQRGSFAEPQSCLDAKDEWRKEVDQVAQFVEECCALKEHYQEISAELYAAYNNWAEGVGIIRKLNQKNFSNRLVRLGCKLHKGTAGKRMIKGIRIGWEK